MPTLHDHGTVPIDDKPDHDDRSDLAQWLEDSGRRKHSADWVASLYAQTPPAAKPPAPPRRRHVTQPELLVLFATAALAYAMQYFIEVELAIASLQGLIVFVALK